MRKSEAGGKTVKRVRRPIEFRLALCCAVLGLASSTQALGAADKAESSPDTWYVEAFTKGAGGLFITHFWSHGPKFRAEMVLRGHRIVTLVNGDHYYAFDELSGTGIAIHRAAGAIRADAKRGRPFAREFEQLLEDGGESVRTQSFGDGECEMYRLTDKAGRRQVCVSKSEPRLPIIVENFNRSTGRTDTLSYTGWMKGLPIPDAFFEPGPNVKLTRLDYEEYRKRSREEGGVGPVPVLYGHLLHGDRDR